MGWNRNNTFASKVGGTDRNGVRIYRYDPEKNKKKFEPKNLEEIAELVGKVSEGVRFQYDITSPLVGIRSIIFENFQSAVECLVYEIQVNKEPLETQKMLNIRCLKSKSPENFEQDVKRLEEGIKFQNHKMRNPIFLKPITGTKEGYVETAAGTIIKQRFKYMYFNYKHG